MPILPYSIRGEDYNINKDESHNMMLKEYVDNDGVVKPIYSSLDLEEKMDESTRADIPATYEDTVKYTAFISPMPIDSILESIENQFNDYIMNEDKNNYVDIFYDALDRSYQAASDDDLHKEDVVNVLNSIQDKFIYRISDLFNNRLTLKISSVEDETYDSDEVELIIRKLYEFFILNAKRNFKVSITNDAKNRISSQMDNHREYMKTIRTMMNNYSPLITTFGPMEFLNYVGDQDIIELFNEGKVVGNFLRKYSPKLYKNEEFEVELINYITMVKQVNEEVFNDER